MKNRRVIYFIVLFLRFGLLPSFSQLPENLPAKNTIEPVLFKGQVFDSQSGSPVPFATILVKGRTFGVVTNDNGTFSLSLQKFAKSDTLQVRLLGYETVEMPISHLSQESVNRISISPAIYSINEVSVSARRRARPSAENVVKMAVSKLGLNSPKTSFMIDGYYRDYLKLGATYLNLFESRVQIEDKGFNHNDFQTSGMRVVAGGLNSEYPIDSSKILSYSDPRLKRIPRCAMNIEGTNELAILRFLDPLRNSDENTLDYINRFDSDFIRNHRFWNMGVVYSDHRSVYKIGFKSSFKGSEVGSFTSGSYGTVYSANKNNPATAVGEIYIDSESYSVLRLDYRVHTSDRFKDNIKLYELHLEYKIVDSLAHLSYLSFNNAVEYASGNSLFYLKNVYVQADDHRIALEFSNTPDKSYLEDNSFCTVKIGSKRVRFKEVKAEDNIVYLYPVSFSDMIADLQGAELKEENFRIRRLKDNLGNIYGSNRIVLGYQFRELFVRDVESEYDPIGDDLIMQKQNSMVFHKYPDINSETRLYFNSNSFLNSLK